MSFILGILFLLSYVFTPLPLSSAVGLFHVTKAPRRFSCASLSILPGHEPGLKRGGVVSGGGGAKMKKIGDCVQYCIVSYFVTWTSISNQYPNIQGKIIGRTAASFRRHGNLTLYLFPQITCFSILTMLLYCWISSWCKTPYPKANFYAYKRILFHAG